MTTELATGGDVFRKYFEVVPAITESEVQAAFRIRHSVYCHDLGWERPRADEMETDSFDPQSLHCLIRSRLSHEYIGCVRLIRAAPGNPAAPLPFELTCGDTLDRSLIDPAQLPREKIAEVSRLAIVGQYRRRKGEERRAFNLQDNDFVGNDQHPRFPWMLVGLYMGVFAIAERHELEQLYMLSEPRLERHLNRIGIANEPIGNGIDHRGLRVPAVMDVQRIIADLDPLMKSVFTIVRAEIAAHHRASA